jgi:hypothetical protein
LTFGAIEQRQPLRSDRPLEISKASNVASRMGQTLNEALVHRFGDQNENDRHCAGRLLQRPHAGATSAKKHVRRQAQKLGAEALRHLEADNAKPIVDLEVAADNPWASKRQPID